MGLMAFSRHLIDNDLLNSYNVIVPGNDHGEIF